ncbi:hypothetical protein [Bacillus ndiopicus]|uniref:hypothetical protein n=1 Tax=Bacillus ndiopicus TaxID=1347368 RepID=UPI0005A6B3B9|nr:hypothetical protein [Bacillus ndiopicus]
MKEFPESNLNKVFMAYQVLYLHVGEGNLELAKQKASLVWDDLQMLDCWYIDDLILLNSLLVLFPLETALEITTMVLKRIDSYGNFERDLTYLKIYFQMDLCLMLLQHQIYELALDKLNVIYENYKQKMSYQMLAGLFTNKAICLLYLNRSVEEELTNLNLLLNLYGDFKLLDSLLKVYENQKSHFRELYQK